MGRILLTGTAGFIASKVAELLLSEGHEVIGVDNLNDAYDVRLKHWRLQRLQGLAGFTFQQVDISDRASLASFWGKFGRFDAVINLAARAGVRPSVDNPWIYFDTNTTGTLNLLELSRQHDTDKFVLASTSSLYGEQNTVPYAEDADTNHVISPYAASKKAAEVVCYTYHQLYQIDVTIFRYFTVYGPAGRPEMSIFRFIQWIDQGRPVRVFGDGRQSRDFTYIDDIARGTVAGLQLRAGYETINLGGDEPVVLMDVIQMIEELLGKKANLVHEPRHPADVRETWANIDKARRMLNWEPQTSIADGVAEAVRWYRDNYDLASQIITTDK